MRKLSVYIYYCRGSLILTVSLEFSRVCISSSSLYIPDMCLFICFACLASKLSTFVNLRSMCRLLSGMAKNKPPIFVTTPTVIVSLACAHISLYINVYVHQIMTDFLHSFSDIGLLSNKFAIKWLLIDFKLCLLVYKCLHQLAAPYLESMIFPISAVSTRLHLRSAGQGDLTVPRTRTVGFGPRSFSVAGPSLWNTLPYDMKQSSLSIAQFCSQLKSVMFVRSFYA